MFFTLLKKYFAIILLFLVSCLLLTVNVYFSLMNIASIETREYFVSAPEIDSTNVKPPVYFGVISRYPPRKIYEGYQPIMDYLTANTPYEFRLKLSNSYEETIQQLANNDVQLAFLGTYIFLVSYEKYGLECILKPISRTGEPYFHGTIITREDSGIDKPEDLAGEAFALTSRQSFTANSVQSLLHRNGIEPRSVTRFKHHTTVLQKVLQGEYAAGAVRNIVADEHAGSGLRIIYRTSPFPGGPISVLGDCDPDIVESVKAALLRIDVKKQVYRDLVENWDSEFRYGFIEASIEDYSKVNLMLEQVGPE